MYVFVFGPFKSHFNTARDTWMLKNPGVALTIYNISERIAQVFEKAFTPTNVLSGFKKRGIHLFNPIEFTDADLLSSAATDRPENMPSDGHVIISRPEKNDDITPTIITDSPEKNILIEREAQKQVSKKTKQNIKFLQAKNEPGKKRKYVQKKEHNYDCTSENENIAYEELSETETWEPEEIDYRTILEGRFDDYDVFAQTTLGLSSHIKVADQFLTHSTYMQKHFRVPVKTVLKTKANYYWFY
ncbi:hypothetical protein ILUMI_20756 [Ignelater luminosus]|uniref:Uncharacterized protein n=1 Tax=Ignelater luminosus TaxID=2038154 RepID=A0A8K0CGV2_IGNLU|nr:hypothetical protein ILUMI_20756 [Ignelater luminosus]